MEHAFDSFEIKILRLPYPKEIKWAGHLESGMDVVLITIRSTLGAIGSAETSVRPNWHSITVRAFVAVLEEVVLPALNKVDLADATATAWALSGIKEHPLAKSLVDLACWDLRASAAGTPLWRLLGAENAAVPVSYTVTRSTPTSMIADAVNAVTTLGVRSLKLKTGQDFEADREAVHGIRKEVGKEVRLFADSNGAHDASEVRHVADMLKEEGVLYFEDPCAFIPDSTFRQLVRECSLPILVDNECRSQRDAALLLDSGAQALSVKCMKHGISDSMRIGRRAAAAGAKVGVGISATSSLGAYFALTLAATMPETTKGIPCEETFFLNVGGYLVSDAIINDGCVTLPTSSSLYALIDWDRVRHFQS